jgi:hypothetical protein
MGAYNIYPSAPTSQMCGWCFSGPVQAAEQARDLRAVRLLACSNALAWRVSGRPHLIQRNMGHGADLITLRVLNLLKP